MIVKEQVDLAESSVLSLRESEPAPDIAKKVGPCVEKTSFGAPVPGYQVGMECVSYKYAVLAVSR